MKPKQLLVFGPLILLLIYTTSSCAVRLIAPYDAISDQKITELQVKFSTFFTQMKRNIGTENASYEKYQEFYDLAKVDLATLEIRARAFEKNELVVQQIDLLKKMTGNLEKLHQIGFASAEEVELAEDGFNRAFTRMIQLQMGLKR